MARVADRGIACYLTTRWRIPPSTEKRYLARFCRRRLAEEIISGSFLRGLNHESVSAPAELHATKIEKKNTEIESLRVTSSVRGLICHQTVTNTRVFVFPGRLMWGRCTSRRRDRRRSTAISRDGNVRT